MPTTTVEFPANSYSCVVCICCIMNNVLFSTTTNHLPAATNDRKGNQHRIRRVRNIGEVVRYNCTRPLESKR